MAYLIEDITAGRRNTVHDKWEAQQNKFINGPWTNNIMASAKSDQYTIALRKVSHSTNLTVSVQGYGSYNQPCGILGLFPLQSLHVSR
jgi:hypothetical protein